ncbi:hypothetical protein [Nocardia panacis]|uniref:hypothetical protein n=1 Tax=Nocardia panacis TaxID=2340916 RepID=UPI0011C3483E|nr:hypothetical protein [Nocardia panacis]
MLGAERPDAITLQAEELRGWAWCDCAEVVRRLPGLPARRAAAARRARAEGVALYLEDGFALA